MKKLLCIVLLSFCCLMGCSNNKDNNGVIDYVKAKELIINEGAILVDVRTSEEYDNNHIDGAISLPLSEINENNVKSNIDNKDTVVIVYCQSGVRSKEASIELKKLGYTNVYDLGSIDNWQEISNHA